MTLRKLTALVIAALALGGGGYDLGAYIHGGDEATISVTVIHAAAWCPVLVVLFGLSFGSLMGHLLSPPQYPPAWTRPVAVAGVVGCSLVAIYLPIAYRFALPGILPGEATWLNASPVVTVLVALAAGVLFASRYLTQHPPDAPAPGQ